MKTIVLAAAAAATLGIAAPAVAQDAANMTFFITSAGPGDGANLGGLAGADAHCQQLAEAAGSTGKTWVAYLSADEGPVNARDRIGAGPWQNFKGDVIATDVAMGHPKIDEKTTAGAARIDPHDIARDTRNRNAVSVRVLASNRRSRYSYAVYTLAPCRNGTSVTPRMTIASGRPK